MPIFRAGGRSVAAAGLTLSANGLTICMISGTGNDKLDRGIGADVMAGGTGNDIYYVGNAGDMVSEAVGVLT